MEDVGLSKDVIRKPNGKVVFIKDGMVMYIFELS